jgi:flagellar hook protein FlgE
MQYLMGLETHTDANGVIDPAFSRNADGISDNSRDAAEVSVDATGKIAILGNVGSVNELGFLKFTDVTNTTSSPNNLEFQTKQVASGDSSQRNFTIYDSLGAPHQIRTSMALESQDSNGSVWRYYVEGEDTTEAFSANEGNRALSTGTVTFDVNGQTTLKQPVEIKMNLQAQGKFSNLTFSIDFSKMTQFSSSGGSEIIVAQDGLAEGVLERYSIGADGVLTGVFSNGLTESLAQIALASFGNNNGLVSQGGNLFSRGPSSGASEVGAAATGKRGSLLSKNLESSNVELTTEFTNLIATQRAYQANARTITTSDSILQELVSLVR